MFLRKIFEKLGARGEAGARKVSWAEGASKWAFPRDLGMGAS